MTRTLAPTMRSLSAYASKRRRKPRQSSAAGREAVGGAACAGAGWAAASEGMSMAQAARMSIDRIPGLSAVGAIPARSRAEFVGDEQCVAGQPAAAPEQSLWPAAF